jgi:antitoxin FitA
VNERGDLKLDLALARLRRARSLSSTGSPHLSEILVADLLVRGIDEAVVRALEERAEEHGRSAEAEHRAILAAAFARPRKYSFAEVLASMPEVGLESDFERLNPAAKAPRVFD